MTHPYRWRAAAAAVFVAVVAVLLAAGPRPAAARPEKAELPPGLNIIPADAAFFAHADVAAILSSKIGKSARDAKAKEIEKALTEIESKTGLTPESVKTFTVFFPHLKDPVDFQSPVFYVTFTKPYDKAKILKVLKEDFKGSDVVEAQPGVYEVRDKPAKEEKKDEKKKDLPRPKKEADEPEMTLVMTDPLAIGIARGANRKFLKPAAAADGPQTPALKAAAGGATATLGVNFPEFPDEIRGDNLPAEVRPFQPLFQSDTAYATAKLAGDKIQFEVRFRSGEKRKVADAEKSLGAGLTLIQTALGFAIGQLEKSKDDTEKAVLPLAQEVLAMARSAKVSSDDTEAVVAATAKSDLPVGPFVSMVFGGGGIGPAARAKDQNNLKQIALAFHSYHDSYEGFPPAHLVSRKGKPMLSWRVMILPIIEQGDLYKQFKLDEPWDSEHNKKVLEKHPMPPVYALPGVTQDGDKTTPYQVFVGNGAAIDALLPTKIQSITDGTSNTALVVTAAQSVPWTKPDDLEFDPKADLRKLLLFRNGGTNIAFCDGSVRFVSEKVSNEVLAAIITKAGGEVIGGIP